MARLFPNRLSTRVPREVARAFRKLKKLPEDFSVHHSLGEIRNSSKESLPDFLVFWQERFGFIIKIAATSQELAESTVQGSLFSSGPILKPEDLGADEEAVLRRFCQQLPPDFPLRRLLLFPNVSQNTMDTISLQQSRDRGVTFLGLDQLGPDRLAAHLANLVGTALEEGQARDVRAVFDPGLVLPESFAATRSPTRERKTAPTLTPRLLDLDQEWCVKNQLFLPLGEESEQVGTGSQTQLVTGVAGSGKSLVLLYRAALLSRLKPPQRLLLLTHNKPILNELRRRLTQLTPGGHAVTCLTFFQWACRHLGSWPERTIGETEIQAILARLQPEPFQVSFLADEIGRIKDHGLTKRTDYLEVDRTGWGKPLQSSQREALWECYRRYQEHLVTHRLVDWHGVAMRFHRGVTSGKIELESYDAILIDEAQFFAKAWFDVVRRALRSAGQLFIAADPTQGFLKRGQSWLASGIEVRGRTTRLRRPYRNTRSILAFAARFFEARCRENPGLDPESFHLPTKDQLDGIPMKGSAPEIIHGPSLQDLHLRAANEMARLRQEGLPAGHVLVLHADSARLPAFETLLARRLGGSGLVHPARDGLLPSQAWCQTSTLNAATGLEAPIVFLLGIDHILDREADPQMSMEERAERQGSHSRLLYMAFTRAGQKLVIFSTSPDRVRLLKQFREADAPSP